MKNLLAGMLALVLCVSAMPLSANAEGETVNVKVTISDKDGNAVLQQKNVTVTDIDSDGALTINDALIIAHNENYEGGAEAGYESAKSEYGWGIQKLWGTANGGSYGYYVNHTASMGVGDAINDGDYLDAFVYTDLENWSDKYTFFDAMNAETLPNISLPLTLSYAGYDESWNPVTLPVEGAIITINGEKTDFVTDANGYVEISFPETGEYIVSAVSDNLNIVKPVLPVTVNATGLEPIESVTYGDVNADGIVDIADVLTLNQHLLGIGDLEGDGNKNADVDLNGTVDDADALNILKSLVDLVSLPIQAE
ncbi:MAG: dockerin type I repeat-containing protein [Oscillospiraceae bacterium]